MTVVVTGAATGIGAAELHGISSDEVVSSYFTDTPLRRLQTSEEAASLVLSLAGESAASITGESVAINGGSYTD
jgi:NAD(P)-dependent dehydrogenase (short-subunit alcohol dehydrogenase family)